MAAAMPAGFRWDRRDRDEPGALMRRSCRGVANLFKGHYRNMQRKKIHRSQASHIDNGSYASIAQNRCTHQAVHLVQMPFQALDHHLLLSKQFIDHKPNLSVAGFDDYRKSAAAALLGIVSACFQRQAEKPGQTQKWNRLFADHDHLAL